MKYCNIDLSLAPVNSFVIATYVTGVEVGIFNGNEFSFGTKHYENDLLELHIFDETKEFRAIKSKNQFRTAVITESEKTKDKYIGYDTSISEDTYFFGERFIENEGNITTLIDKGQQKEFYFKFTKEQFDAGMTLKVINYIDFDENDMLFIKNYRLAGIYFGGKIYDEMG